MISITVLILINVDYYYNPNDTNFIDNNHTYIMEWKHRAAINKITT